MQGKAFGTVSEECIYWQDIAKKLQTESSMCKREIHDLQHKIRIMEADIQTAKVNSDAKLCEMHWECERLKTKLARTTTQCGASSCEDDIKQLSEERNSLKLELTAERVIFKKQIRELEQKNDDLERSNRELNESAVCIESLLDRAVEKAAFLETEIDDQEELQMELKRKSEEVEELKQELKNRTMDLTMANASMRNNTSTFPIVEVSTGSSSNDKYGSMESINLGPTPSSSFSGVSSTAEKPSSNAASRTFVFPKNKFMKFALSAKSTENSSTIEEQQPTTEDAEKKKSIFSNFKFTKTEMPAKEEKTEEEQQPDQPMTQETAAAPKPAKGKFSFKKFKLAKMLACFSTVAAA